MLEQITLSISTAIFLICTMIVNSVMPKEAVAEEMLPIEDVAAVDYEKGEQFSIVGKWNSDGRIFEFTDGGKFIFGEKESKYAVAGNTLTVDMMVSGESRQYTLPISIVSNRVVSINGVRMYKIEP